MTFTSSIRRRKSVSSSGSGRTGPARARARFRAVVEALEIRCVLAHISVTSTFVNNSGSALIGISDQLDHGVWTNNNVPPSRIEAGETVSWESESDGVATGTEGEVQYEIEGTSITMNVHWDDPFVGSNSFDITGLDNVGYHTTAGGEQGDNVSASYSINIVDSSGDGIPDAWKTGGIPVGGGGPTYTLPGATVGHHDLYVEADSMTGFNPLPLPGITAASNPLGAPIVITTSGSDGLTTGNRVTISGVAGDPAADGNFTVTRVDSTHFSLNGTSGTGGSNGTGGSWSLTDIDNADNAHPGLDLATGTDLDLVVNSFLNAPVSNADGTTGIYLHIEIDGGGDAAIPAAPWYTTNAAGNVIFPAAFDTIRNNTSGAVAGGFGSPGERAGQYAAGELAAKKLVYHYTIFGQSYDINPATGIGNGSSGISDLPGDDFTVTLGGGVSVETQVATFMHEFGHNLGLGHGGEAAPELGTFTAGSAVVTLADTSTLYAGLSVAGNLVGALGNVGIASVDSPTQITLSSPVANGGQAMLYFSDGTNYKPNYQSIMNYAWQFPAGAPTAFNASWQLDYSRTAFPTLNEASLNESAGIGGYAGLTEGIVQLAAGGFARTAPETGAVDWNGNGTTNDVNVSLDLNGDGAIGTLVGSEDWSKIVYNFRPTYSFSNDGSHADVADLDDPLRAPVTVSGGFTVSGVEGSDSQAQTVATFTDPSGARPVGTYSASIDWGDGSPVDSGGAISFNAATNVFSVLGHHKYAEEGQYTIKVIVHSNGAVDSNAVTSTAQVADPAVVATGGFSLTAVEGALSALQTVATFTDPGGPETLGNYGASIAWGDGTTSTGTISGPDGGGVFTVKGSHTYAEESSPEHPGSNPYTILVTISHDVAPNATATSHATVSDPSVVGTGGFKVTVLECQPFANSAVATFTDPGGPEDLDDYGATIAWGDGHVSAGTISGPDSRGVFTVGGGNTFAEDGTYVFTVTLHHELSPDVKVTGTAVVLDNIGILLLDPTASGALSASGNAAVTVADVNNCGAIVIDSKSPSAGDASGNAVVTAGEYDITGTPGTSTNGHGVFAFTDEKNTGEAPTADPLGGVPTPGSAGPTFGAVNDSGGSTLVLHPGTYNGGIHVSGKGSIVLSPGLYYLNGGGFSVSGQGSVSGDGVTIYNAPANPSDGFSFSGQAVVRLSGPTAGVDQSIVFFQDRASTATFQVSGNAALNLSGILYAADAEIQVSGNGVISDRGNAARTVGAQIDARDLTVSGNGVIHIDVSNNSPESLHLGASDTPPASKALGLLAGSGSAASAPPPPAAPAIASPPPSGGSTGAADPPDGLDDPPSDTSPPPSGGSTGAADPPDGLDDPPSDTSPPPAGRKPVAQGKSKGLSGSTSDTP